MNDIIKYESKNYINRKNIKPFAENPWINELATKLSTKRNYAAFASRSVDIIDNETGEVSQGVTYVGTSKEVDKEEFVKFYAGTLDEVLNLPKKAKDLFKIIIAKYIDTNTTAERADVITINYKIAVDEFGYTAKENTFIQALNILMLNSFLAPRKNYTEQYWLNPNLFVKGDRIILVKEYRLKKSKNEQLEERGQLRLGGVE